MNHNPSGRIPKLEFPRFDGDNPRRWKTRAEKYFHMNSVLESLWIEIFEMHFDGVASLWFQSIEHLVPTLTWSVFCALLHDRFDRDRHESMIRQSFRIQMTSTIIDYLSHFTEIMDQLRVYTPQPDEISITQQFIDGLRPDIKSVIALHHPKTLDSAASLALLQEEMCPVPPSRYARHGNWNSALAKAASTQRGAHPLPLPPRQDKAMPSTRHRTRLPALLRAHWR